MEILGVRVDNLSKREILEKIEFFLSEEKPAYQQTGFHQIATVNPEFILKAQKNQQFREVLNLCDLNVADGVGLKYAFVRYGKWLKARFSGADLLHVILEKAQTKNLPIFLAISKDGLSSYEEIKEALSRIYPKLEIFGENIDPKNAYKPETANCQLVFCNFGAPNQEIFLNLLKNDTLRLAMGVGGSFDFVTGKVRRAPLWMRNLGLEWLYRLIQEPKYRMKRIFRAVLVFPVKVLINR